MTIVSSVSVNPGDGDDHHVHSMEVGVAGGEISRLHPSSSLKHTFSLALSE